MLRKIKSENFHCQYQLNIVLERQFFLHLFLQAMEIDLLGFAKLASLTCSEFLLIGSVAICFSIGQTECVIMIENALHSFAGLH